DPELAEGKRLRAWDRVHDDLVERQIGADRTPCLTLGLGWAVQPVEQFAGLRLVDDTGRLVETQGEGDRRGRLEAEGMREGECKAREGETKAREAAEARVRALEEELRRRDSEKS